MNVTRRQFGCAAFGAFAISRSTRSLARQGQGRASLSRLRSHEDEASFGEARRSPEGAQAAGDRTYRYVHLDVFTDRRLAGNQLLVFVEPTGLDTATMQAMTKESNYSENTFVFPPEQTGTDYRVRIFTRTAEAPFAGHPTIGTAFALAHVGRIRAATARVVFGLGVGPTPLDLEWASGKLAFAWMTQLNPTFGKSITDANALGAVIGLPAAAVRMNPDRATTVHTVGVQPNVPAGQEVSCGSNFFVVPLPSRQAVDAAVFDRAKADAMFTAAGIQRRGIYVFTTERGQDDATAYSRLLSAGGIEDPATGSAAGPAGCFAAKYGLVPPDRVASMVFLQGVLAGRPSRLHVKVGMNGSDITSVKVGGTSVVVGEGSVSV
jgi:trans-2,3-dihydro-3-hydroxyanthranilate isomerase